MSTTPREHRHIAPANDYATETERLAAARAACPVCGRHDHSDTRPFGFDRDRHPIPAWWFTCPKCGNHNEAQVYIAEWTLAGIHHMKGAAA